MASGIGRCKKCCETLEKVLHLEKGVNTIRQDNNKSLNKCVQTDGVHCSMSVNVKETGTSTMTYSDQPSSTQVTKERQEVMKREEVDRAIQEKNPLSRERMLKLLDQAQIGGTPLKTGRIGQSDIPTVVDCEAMQDISQRHRQVVTLEKLLFGDSNC